MGQQFVQFNFTQHGAQRGLGKLLRLPVIILHLHHGLRGVYHAPVDHGIDLQRDVIARDDVLGRDLKRLLAQVDPDHLLHRRKDKDQAGTFGVLLQAAKGEDHAALILAQDLDAVESIKNKNSKWNENKKHWRLHLVRVGKSKRILWHRGQQKQKNHPATRA